MPPWGNSFRRTFSRYRSKRERLPLDARSLSADKLIGDAGIVADDSRELVCMAHSKEMSDEMSTIFAGRTTA